jgi:hypothetical protein
MGWALAVLAGLLALAPPAPAPSPTPTPTATPRPRVDQQVEKVLDEKERREPPRFESSIEVVGESPQTILDRRLRGLDLECGPTGGGAPTEAETRAVRPHPAASGDLLALGKLIAEKVKGKGPERFFLYRVRRGDTVGYTLREGRMPDAEFYNTAGAIFELFETFSDAKQASVALSRMERGFATAVSSDSRGPIPSWVTAPCRPPK